MNKIEKIRAEIERLKSKYRHNGLWTSSFQSDLAMAKIESMNELLAFLDALSEEPDKSLDEEIREYMSNEDNNPFDWDWRDKRDCARHFAEWGAEHAKK